MAHSKIYITRVENGFIINIFDQHNISDYADDYDLRVAVSNKEDLIEWVRSTAFAPYSKEIKTKEEKK